jgi:sugar/nucleoside kinase (ribokinase family)
MAAARLGLAAGIVTVAGEELDWQDCLPGVEIARWPATATTSFENLYREGHRSQRILAVAEGVPTEAVPRAWQGVSIVHLAPVAHEIDGRLPAIFPHSLVGLTPQGLLRRWDADGVVRQGPWRGDDRLLARSQVVIFSEEDLAGDPTFLPRCLDRVPITLLTRGALGATLFVRGDPKGFPAFPVREVDPTGAGDVFAAAFLIEYHRTRDPYHSTAFACCAASFVAERPGLEGVPHRAMVEERLLRYRQAVAGA